MSLTCEFERRERRFRQGSCTLRKKLERLGGHRGRERKKRSSRSPPNPRRERLPLCNSRETLARARREGASGEDPAKGGTKRGGRARIASKRSGLLSSLAPIFLGAPGPRAQTTTARLPRSHRRTTFRKASLRSRTPSFLPSRLRVNDQVSLCSFSSLALSFSSAGGGCPWPGNGNISEF